MSLPSIIVSGDQLSDLFFNYDHPEYDKLFGNDGDPTQEQIEGAIRADAKEFASCYMRDFDENVADALAADFLKRL